MKQSIWRKLFSRFTTTRRRPVQGLRHRPRLEALEDRFAPAVTLLNAPLDVQDSGTLSYTVSAGTNRLLVVAASDADDTGTTDVISVTYNGIPLTEAIEVTDGLLAVDSIWYLALGDSGSPTTADIVITTNDDDDAIPLFIGAIAYQDVDQTNPVDGAQSAANPSGANLSSSLNVVSAVGNVVFDLFDIYDSGNTGTQTEGPGQTAQHDENIPAVLSAFYRTSTELGAPIVTMSWDSSGESFIHVAVNINQASALPAVSITANDASASEHVAPAVANPGQFTVTRTGPTTSALTVNYTVAGTANNGTDYTLLTGSVVIGIGQSSAVIDVNVANDPNTEGPETVIVTLSADAAYSLGAPTSDTVTIADNEPEVSITANDAAASEHVAPAVANPGQFTVTRTGDTTAALTVNYTVGGTAGNGTDYTALTGSVVIGIGQSSAVIDVSVINDPNTEGSETVILTLAAGAYTLANPTSATVTIADNEPEVSITANDAAASEHVAPAIANPGQFTVTRTGDTTAALTVNYTVGGTAGNGTDYTLLTGSVVIGIGQSSAVIDVSVINDPNTEGSETVIVTLSADAAYTLANPTSATVTIADNEPEVSITANDAAASEHVAPAVANPGQFTVTRTGDTTAALTVNYTVGGTAGNGTDYTVLTGSVVIGIGQSSAVIDVSVINDPNTEGSETVILTLAAGAYTLANPTSATVTIADNEPEVSITANDAAASEHVAPAVANPGQFTVTRTGDTTAALTVNYTVGGTAGNGTDYTVLTGSVIIGIGQSSAVIDVSVINDPNTEGSETVILTLAAGAYTLANPTSATVTIADNEPEVSITANDAAASEHVAPAIANPGQFTVTRTGDTTAALTVNYTVGGTAGNGTDYTLLTGSVVIGIGQSSAVIDVSVINDPNTEGSETVIVTLSADAAYTLANPISATVTIADNEPEVSITANDPSAAEHVAPAVANPGQFTVTRTGDTTAALTVNYTVGGTAGNGTDYTLLTGSVVIGIGQSSAVIDVSVINDPNTEGSETVIVTLSADAAYTLANPISATVTIADNEPEVSITANDPSAAEHVAPAGANPGQFTVTRTGDTTAPLTVNYTVTGTASNGTDYTLLTGSVVIGIGQSSAVIDVSVINDPNTEGPETVIVTLSADAAYTLANPTSATVTIADNEPEVSITANDPSAAEHVAPAGANPGQFTVTRTGDTTAPLTVNYTVTGTASNGTDYTLLTGSVVIGIGQSAAVIDVSVINDPNTEGPETVIVTLSADAAYTLANPTSATVTIADNEPEVSIVANDGSAAEHVAPAIANPGQFTVTRTGDTTAALTVFYTVAGTASNGTDYTLLTGSVVIGIGQSSAVIDVDVINDPTTELPESVFLTLSANAAYTLANPIAAFVIIADNEPEVSIAANDPDASEPPVNDDGQFTVTRTGDTTAALTINYTVTGTATNGIDYATVTGTVVIGIGQSSAVINVDVIDDALLEGPETVIVTLAAGAYTLADPITATVTIADVEADLSVTKTDAPDPVLAGTNLTYTITVTNFGPSDATSVTLTDTVPANTTFVSFAAPAGWSSITPAFGGTGPVTSSIGTLASGATATFTFVVNVNSVTPHNTILSNNASVTSITSDPFLGNNDASATTTVIGLSDLTLTKSDNVSGITSLGLNWTWTLHVANIGTGPATFNFGQVIVLDNLPNANMLYGTVTLSNVVGVAGAINSAITSNNLISQPAGASVTIVGGGSFDLTFTATPTAAGTFVNPRAGGSAKVDPNNNLVELSEANNTGSDSVLVNSAVVITTASPLASWTINQPGYSQTITATGGTGAKTFTVASGALPAGLTLNAISGAITGTPTQVGTFNVTIRATDAKGAFAQKVFSITINAGITFNLTTLPNYTVGTPYSQTVTASGGTGNKVMSVTPVSGSLPAGLTITLSANTFKITGTPTTNTTFVFDLTATDTLGATFTRRYTLKANTGGGTRPPV